jgi:hypothetical protein
MTGDSEHSRLRGTSSATRTLTARELAAMRPGAVPKERAPRRPREAPGIERSIACFCGEVFAEGQAVEFMLHLRAEVGDDLRLLAKVRQWRRNTTSRPEYRARARAARARKLADPAVREERNRRERERRAADPGHAERRREYERSRAADPGYRGRRNERAAAARAAAGKPCACGCGEMTRAGRDYKPGHHQRDREPVKRPGTSGRPELALGMLRLHGALTAPDIARLAGEAAAVTRYSEALRRLEKSGRVRRDGREKRGRVTAVRWALTLPGRYMFLTHLATLQS